MARGGYTFAEVKDWTREQWYFIFHYQELAISQQEDFLTSAMGVLWDRKSLASRKSGEAGKPRDKLLVPLSLAIKPDLLDFVYRQFGMGGTPSGKGGGGGQPYIGGGSYKPKKGEVVLSMADMPKDEFLKKVGMR
jgi:hypothetical protein